MLNPLLRLWRKVCAWILQRHEELPHSRASKQYHPSNLHARHH